ncbi:MAG: cation transporter [Gammaproteobacteria bacterium]|nr:MAG: cation transporter [Gammaproteobacteria bacterium]
MTDRNSSVEKKSNAAQRVTIIGAAVNLLLSVVKIVGGYFGQSAALLADGIHSLSDLISDAMVMFAIKHGSQPADEDHPYGHARIETAATAILGTLLALVAVGIAWDAIERVMHRETLIVPGMIVILIALLSIISNEWLYHYTLRIARQVRSSLLEANAWHHRSDAVSSVVVLVGVIGAIAGVLILDAVAAIIVALMILKIAWELISSSFKELVDTAVNEETLSDIRDVINKVDGVVNLHLLRTRQMGPSVLVDAHIQVNPRLSVSEGHQIADTVRARLLKQVDAVEDVTIHIDPEDDEFGPVNQHLPLRSDLMEMLENDMAALPEAADINNIVLHYLDGKVEIELVLPFPEEGADAAERIQEKFSDIAHRHQAVSSILVRYQ